MFALTKLQELGEASQGGRQITGAEDEQKHHKSSSEERRQSPSHAPNRIFYTPDHDSRDGLEIIGYVVGGIAGFLLILYVIANASYSSDDNNTLCLGLIFLSLIVGIIILFVSNKNPG
jgi:hypothetical protein